MKPPPEGQTAGIGFFHARPLGKTSSTLSVSFLSAATITVRRAVALSSAGSRYISRTSWLPAVRHARLHAAWMSAAGQCIPSIRTHAISRWIAKLTRRQRQHSSLSCHRIQFLPSFRRASFAFRFSDRALRPQHPCGVLELNLNIRICPGLLLI
jgi:hypothetical protein